MNVKINTGRRSVYFQGTKVYDKLPENLKTATNIKNLRLTQRDSYHPIVIQDSKTLKSFILHLFINLMLLVKKYYSDVTHYSISIIQIICSLSLLIVERCLVPMLPVINQLYSKSVVKLSVIATYCLRIYTYTFLNEQFHGSQSR